MIGLIKKDLLLIKSNIKLLAIILLICVAIDLYTGTFSMPFILPFICIMLSISTFNYDDFNKWNAYAITLPNSKKQIVKSKYIFTLIVLIFATLVSIGISAIVSLVNKSAINLHEVLGSFLVVSLVVSAMYPAIYKYGVEKGRIAIFIIMFIVVFVGITLSKFIDILIINNYINNISNYFYVILPVVCILTLFISYTISKRIYMKKEY